MTLKLQRTPYTSDNKNHAHFQNNSHDKYLCNASVLIKRAFLNARKFQKFPSRFDRARAKTLFMNFLKRPICSENRAGVSARLAGSKLNSQVIGPSKSTAYYLGVIISLIHFIFPTFRYKQSLFKSIKNNCQCEDGWNAAI